MRHDKDVRRALLAAIPLLHNDALSLNFHIVEMNNHEISQRFALSVRCRTTSSCACPAAEGIPSFFTVIIYGSHVVNVWYAEDVQGGEAKSFSSMGVPEYLEGAAWRQGHFNRSSL
jgi:hypothetical protein